MRKKLFRPQPEKPEINLTPLIDVVFVILIMFIVIAPLLDVDEVELAAKGDSGEFQPTLSEKSPITLHVLQDNSLKFNNSRVGITELPSLLLQAKQEHPGAKPQLFHDRRAAFGTYQAVKNAAESAGFHEMDVVLAPSS